MGRQPNTACFTCSTEVYRRPAELATGHRVFCTPECRNKVAKRRARACLHCTEVFKPGGPDAKYCSRKCSNHGRTGMQYKVLGRSPNRSEAKMLELRAACDFDTCMVRGCSYRTTLDVHRLVPGKQGGEYVLGNMFAICPNHHAEVTRGLVELTKVGDFSLEARNTRKVPHKDANSV